MLGSRLMSASFVTKVDYKGSVTKEVDSASDWDSSGEALDVLSVASVGDLVVIAFSFDFSTSSFSWGGMTFTNILNGTLSASPGYYVGYRVIQSGDANPYVTGASGRWQGLSVVASVFGEISVSEAEVNDAVGISGSGMPNPPSLNADAGLWVSVGHIDDTAVTDWAAPTNYELAAYAASTASGSSGVSSTAIAYRIESLSSDDPSAFGGSGDDSWHAETIAFT